MNNLPSPHRGGNESAAEARRQFEEEHIASQADAASEEEEGDEAAGGGGAGVVGGDEGRASGPSVCHGEGGNIGAPVPHTPVAITPATARCMDRNKRHHLERYHFPLS